MDIRYPFEIHNVRRATPKIITTLSLFSLQHFILPVLHFSLVSRLELNVGANDLEEIPRLSACCYISVLCMVMRTSLLRHHQRFVPNAAFIRLGQSN